MGIFLPKETHNYLCALPAQFVLKLLEWAPPIVSLGNAAGEAQVIANGLTAFIAKHVIPHRKIKVRVLKYRTESRYSIIDLARFSVTNLEHFVDRERDRIICEAPDPTVASLISGLSYPRCAQIRKGTASPKLLTK